MERHHKRRSRTLLNLVSLMDIFTILVFFLLVNSSNIQVAPDAKAIKLPESVSPTKPHENVVVMVTPDQVLVQGHAVASTQAVMTAGNQSLPGLHKALEQAAQPNDKGSRGKITLLGDKTLPYRVLRRVMLSCTRAHYGHISLAVIEKSKAQQGQSGS